ncbi:phage tail tape measure protein [Chryseomicrobium aureum]|uniref:phage tail tape measure protein n=1 Tax=Chryseomicrobium aureum TaxID=1441723 RepID=UPI00370D6F0F
MADKSIGNLKGRITMEIEEMKGKLKEARDELGNMSGSSKQVNEDFGRIQTAGATVFAAVSGAIAVAAVTAADFEKQMSRVKAISGATETEFKSLKEEALRLGATTSKSASEVAKGMEDMAAMGFSVNEIMAAMPGVISAAEAAGSDLAVTSGIVAAALNAFQLEASEASRVADVLAMTANVSAAGVEDMGYAFKYAAPIANSLGISMEEVAAAIGIMTNAGLEGSQAGTSLRQILISLNNPAEAQAKIMEKLGFSMRDANGESKSLSEIIGDLTKATEGMTKAEKLATIAKLVGSEAASGMVSILEGGVDQLDEFTDALRNSEGAAKDAADVMMDNFAGSFEEFQGALETLGIKVGDSFLPIFRDAVDAAGELVNKFNEIDGKSIMVTGSFIAITAAVATTLATVGKLSLALLAFTATPVGAAIVGVSLLAGAIGAAALSQRDATEVSLEHANALIEEQQALETSITRYDQLNQKMKLSSDELDRFVDLNSLMNQTANPEILSRLKEEQNGLLEKSGLTNDEFSEFLQLNKDLIETVPDTSLRITEEGNAMVNTTEAAKGLNAEKIRMIELELEAQLAQAQANEEENLRKKEQVIKDINAARERGIELAFKLSEAEAESASLERQYEQAKKDNDLAEIQRLELLMTGQQEKVRFIKDEQAEQANLILKKEEEKIKIEQAIGLLDETKQKMVELQLAQVGINAKKGEELNAIDTAISKLQEEKRKIDANSSAAEKNTSEYRDAVGAINDKIGSLEAARRKVLSINGAAVEMNRLLGQSITKTVYVQNGGSSINRPTLQRHSGGRVEGPSGKLHSGGFPNSLLPDLQRMPQHNEVDVRLLKNEWVLTEAQQANLMRMVDAGFTNQRAGSSSDEELLTILSSIYQSLSSGLNAKVYLDTKEVARDIEPHISAFQYDKTFESSRGDF